MLEHRSTGHRPRWHHDTRELERPHETVIELDPSASTIYRFINRRAPVEVEVRVSRAYWGMIEVRGFGKPRDPWTDDLDDKGSYNTALDLAERGDIWVYGPYPTHDGDRYCWESCTYFGGLDDARYHTPFARYYQPTLPGIDGPGYAL